LLRNKFHYPVLYRGTISASSCVLDAPTSISYGRNERIEKRARNLSEDMDEKGCLSGLL